LVESELEFNKAVMLTIHATHKQWLTA